MDQAWKPGPWAVSEQDYYADTSFVSHTMLEVYRKSPVLYHRRYVLQVLPAEAPTPSMVLGSAFHALTLEPGTFADRFAVAPPGVDRRTTAGKAEWESFLHLNGGKTVLSAGQHAQLQAMQEGVCANNFASKLLALKGPREQAVRWISPATQLPAKCKIDLRAGLVLGDLKTAINPGEEAFGRAAYNFGYHRQAAWYLEGAAEALGLPEARFVHVVCGTEEPYECRVYELDPPALRLGRLQVASDARELRRSMDTQTWTSPRAEQLVTLSLPRWALNGMADE